MELVEGDESLGPVWTHEDEPAPGVARQRDDGIGQRGGNGGSLQMPALAPDGSGARLTSRRPSAQGREGRVGARRRRGMRTWVRVLFPGPALLALYPRRYKLAVLPARTAAGLRSRPTGTTSAASRAAKAARRRWSASISPGSAS